MKKYSKKLLTLILALPMVLSMSVGIVFADDEQTVEPYSVSISVVDGDGNSFTVTGDQIKASQSVVVTQDDPWTYQSKGAAKEAYGIFYNLKSILETAGIDYASEHGLKVTASDGFTTGYTTEQLDKVYIFDLSTVYKGGSIAGEAGKYGTAVNGSAGKLWANDVVSIEATSHTPFVKDGKTYDYCAICDENMLEVSGISDLAYTGKALTQKGLTVKIGDKVLKEDTDYTVTYENNLNVGEASLTIKGVESSSYYFNKNENGVTETFNISAAKATVTSFAPAKKVYTVKKGTSKLKKSHSFKISAEGLGGAKLSYSKKSGDKKITISSTGKVKAKKGLKKGTYKVKVNVKAAATDNTAAGTVVKTIKVVVK